MSLSAPAGLVRFVAQELDVSIAGGFQRQRFSRRQD